MTEQEERILAVLEGKLPDEVLSVNDVELLKRRVDAAILRKQTAGHVIIFEGEPHVLH